jgi:hypothetical protein
MTYQRCCECRALTERSAPDGLCLHCAGLVCRGPGPCGRAKQAEQPSCGRLRCRRLITRRRRERAAVRLLRSVGER